MIATSFFLEAVWLPYASSYHTFWIKLNRATNTTIWKDITPGVNLAHHMLITYLKINTFFFFFLKTLFSKIIFMKNRFCLFFKKITYLHSSWAFYAVTSYIWFSPLALSKPTLKVKLIQSKPRIWLNSISQEKAKPQRIFRHEAPAHSPVLQSSGIHCDCSTTLKSPATADSSWLQHPLLKPFVPACFFLIPVLASPKPQVPG